MSNSEFYFVLGFGIPVFMVFAIASLIVLFFQAKQIAEQEQTNVGGRAALGGSSFALSVLASVGIGFFAGHIVAAALIVFWFLTAASMGSIGLGDVPFVGITIATIPVLILIVLLGMLLAIWPLSVLSIRGFRLMKQKQGLLASSAPVSLALVGAVCCVLAVLTAFGIMTAIGLEFSGKRLGLT